MLKKFANLAKIFITVSATFAEHLQKLGKHLDTSVEQYNKAMGSLDRQVLSGARKFTELGIEKKKPIPELKIVENTTKSI